MMDIDYSELGRRYLDDGVRAVGLFGSHARGDQGRYGDIDIVRLLGSDEKSEPVTHLVDGHFVVVSDAGPADVEAWFSSPDVVTDAIRGVSAAKPLVDPDGYLDEIIRRARGFEWTPELQGRADAETSRMMVGLIEEVQKALEGLRRGDVGRMLVGKHGLSWWMLKVMKIKKGILLSGDNGTFPEVLRAMGEDSEWSRLCRVSFGVGGSFTLEQETRAGLELYALTASLVRPGLFPEHVPLIDEVIRRIEESRTV